MSSTLLTIFILGMVIFLVYRANRKRPDGFGTQAHTESIPTVPLSEDERLAGAAADAQARWADEFRAVEKAHSESMLPIKDKLEKARQLVTRSGVGDAACDILRIMWHWPSWSKRDDWKIPMPIAGLDGGKYDGQQGTWLGWNWGNVPFRLESTVSASSYMPEDSSILGDLKLIVDGDLVMYLKVKQQLGDEYDTWRMYSVDALKAGPWMAQVNELAGRLRIANSQRYRDTERNSLVEKAQKIELD